ncbi:MAG: tetratricopeptide repeat protein [Gammaproteobacteria bacterium]|nr:tetratricopeptide repeat protein [Gammaproteobacteria bacterium]
MSLINKVINDLEERQAFVANKDEKIFRGLTSADTPAYKNNMITMNMFIVILFLIASVSGTYALMENRAEKILGNIDYPKKLNIDVSDALSNPKFSQGPLVNTHKNDISTLEIERVKARIREKPLKLDFSIVSLEKVKTEPLLESSSQANSKMTSIQSIAVNEKDDVILLNLKLGSRVNYNAYTLRNPNRIVVEVDDVVLEGVLPDPGKLQGVKNVYLNENHDGKFIMTMNTNDFYLLDDTELLPINEGYGLSISMINTATINADLDSQISDVKVDGSETLSSVSAEYGEMTKNISLNNVDKARVAYIDANELYRTGKPKEANDLLISLLRDNPEHKGARTLLAQQLISQGQLEQAEETLYEGLNTQDVDSVWVDLYARLLVNKGDVDSAIEILSSVTPDVNNEPDYYAFLAALYQKREQHSEAIKIYREVLKVSPDKSVWWMGMAISLESLQKNGEALYAYNRALRGNRMTEDLQKYVLGKIEYLNKRS